MEGEKGNRAKAAIDKAVRLLNSPCSVLHMVCCNGEALSEKVEYRYSDKLVEENFAKIILKLHIRGLRKALGFIESLISEFGS